MFINDGVFNNHVKDIQKHIPFVTASNSGNTYSIQIDDLDYLEDGQAIMVKFNAASTGAISVSVNGGTAKPVLDYFKNAVTNVKANVPANLVYESTSDSFILLGKGGDGDATAPDILEGKTATVSSGVITGTMPNNPLKTPIVSIPYVGVDAGASDYGTIYVFIPKGAYLESASGKNSESAVIIPNTNIKSENLKSGITFGNVVGKSSVVDTADADADAGDIRDGKSAYINGQKVSGSCPVQATAAQEVVPGTSDIVKPAGIYDGDITIKGIQPSDIGGRRWASGTVATTNGGKNISVTNIGFIPSIIILNGYKTNYGFYFAIKSSIANWHSRNWGTEGGFIAGGDSNITTTSTGFNASVDVENENYPNEEGNIDWIAIE